MSIDARFVQVLDELAMFEMVYYSLSYFDKKDIIMTNQYLNI